MHGLGFAAVTNSMGIAIACNNRGLFFGYNTCLLPAIYGLYSIYHCFHSGTQVNGTWPLCRTLSLTMAYELS